MHNSIENPSHRQLDLQHQPEAINSSAVNDSEEMSSSEKLKTEFEFIKDIIYEHLTHEHKVNEGNNGVIFKISRRHESAAEAEHQETRDFAGKLLKVGDYNDLENEFKNQQLAYGIIAKAIENGADPNTLAKIPQVYFCDALDADEDLKSHLSEEGVNIPSNNKVGVFLMDWVEGKDLATRLFTEALERKNSPYLETIDKNNFNMLHGAVGIEFEFAKPGGKATREGERIFERRKVEAQNEQRLYKFLQKDGYIFPKETLSRIKNTIKLLADNGMALWDSHARNIMTSDDYEDVYLIDFAPQKEVIGESATTLDPYTLTRNLEPLTMTMEELNQVETDNKMSEFNADYQRRIKNSVWIDKRVNQYSDTDTMLKELNYYIVKVSDIDLEEYLFVLVNSVETEKITSLQAEEILKTALANNPPHWKAEKINLAIKKVNSL